MSYTNSNNRHITLPNKTRKKLEVVKNDYLISENSNRIMKALEEKYKAMKVKAKEKLGKYSSSNNQCRCFSPMVKIKSSTVIYSTNEKSSHRLPPSLNNITSITCFKPKKELIIVNKPLTALKYESNLQTTEVKKKRESKEKIKAKIRAKAKSLSESNSFNINDCLNNTLHRNHDHLPLKTLHFNPNNCSKVKKYRNKVVSSNDTSIKNTKKNQLNINNQTKIKGNNQMNCNKNTNLFSYQKQLYNNSTNVSSIMTSKLISPLKSNQRINTNHFKLIKHNKKYFKGKPIKINTIAQKAISYSPKYKTKTEQNSFESHHFSNKTNNAMNDTTISIKAPLSIDNVILPSSNTTTGTLNTIRSNSTTKKITKIFPLSISGYSLFRDEKINQDNYFITQNYLNNPDDNLLGICDGHGENGHLVSGYIANSLPEKLLEVFVDENNEGDTQTKIIESFNRLNKELIATSDIDTRYSGTTCVSAIITREKIICANIGDSRSVLARYEKGVWNVLELSRDHKAIENDESQRIIKKGGRIASYINQETLQNIGPQRVWLKEANIPGLAMTRSFGDQIAHCIGVICEPEIREYHFNGTEAFIVLASDGVWEYIDSLECIYLIKDYYLKGDIWGACNSIVEEASKRWKKKANSIDDITVLIAFFE